ncbi:MAG: hypothetical protein HZY73_10960 [Micropruina sp.]|nr:MAG: hypothetical protein HZY73_10960 [Micropruina sp.]
MVFTLDFTEGAHGLVALMPYRPGGLWRATRFEDLRVGTAPSVIWGERRDDPVL